MVHFWSLVFIYIWAGPHHLLYTALPDWAQTLGMIFSLMLWAPSWGGMLADGRTYMQSAWWITVFPGLAIVAAVLAVNFTGDALRDSLDPRTAGKITGQLLKGKRK